MEKKVISRRKLRQMVGASRAGRKQATRGKKYRGKPGRKGAQRPAAKLKILVAQYKRDGYTVV